MNISSIILSGGRATRMGGIDKGLVFLQQKPLIQHVIERIAPQVDEVFINANRELEQYMAFNLPILQDETHDYIGPLAGFSLGLQHANHDLVLTVPCDSPLLPMDLAKRLLRGVTEANVDIAVACSNGDTHPVFCLMKKSLLSSLTTFIENGGRKVSTWQKSQPYIEVDFSDCPDGFINLNTLDDITAFTLKL
jgi:molybdenum cofactor guanylyltransferase